ncbi:HAD family hydrolase [Streptomyces griseosporeus]|uniref:HAD family hydrolase n=1 Tax=Streptomyces griseosporeus TaxID=1910 RepID=UPI003702E156
MRPAIWTDFRGVLTPPLREGLRAYCVGKEFTPAQLGQCLRVIADRYGCPDGMAVLDSGILSERQWAAEIERELAGRFGITADLSRLGSEWWSDRRVDAVWLAALRRWRQAGAFVGLVSNLPVDWKPYFTAFLDWDELFDDVLLSCDTGTRKPDAALFRLAESRTGLPPEAHVLVDDLDANVAGARRAGWTGVTGGGDHTPAAVERIDALVRAAAPRNHPPVRVGAPHQGAGR